ncbi:alpha/beta fold hydrolase [Streptomyces sp. NPDC002888]|uniref:alpha/beta fold hydrolase n=1 Tax=Streptomyces sp. NPDC002888 TaxID=3364668 RepID=UPI003675D067
MSSSPPPRPPILLLHGAWHGSWCWEPVTTALSAAGHPVLAIDLPGHGLQAPVPDAYIAQDLDALATAVSPLGGLSAADCAEPAVEAVHALHAAFGPVVVVAHSLAGVVLNHVGEAVPDLIARLIHLAALAPAPGRTVFEDAATPEFGDSLTLGLPIGDPGATGAVRINWNSPDAGYRSTARQCFYGDVPDATADAATRLLSPDVPVRLYSDPAPPTAERWGTVSRSWIRCTLDRTVPVAAQDAFIGRLDAVAPGTPFEQHTLETGHSPFLSAPEMLSSVLLKAVNA